ncbi:MAG: hypothetical protein OHK0056_13220 [Bacteriovoracaceae bacterium]
MTNNGGSTKKSRGGSVNNSPSSVSAGYGRILKDNPIILSGNYNFGPNDDLGPLLKRDQDFITNNPYLIGSCTAGGNTITECFEVRQDSTADYLSPISGKWAFPTSTTSFDQVQTFGHLDRFLQMNFARMEYAASIANLGFIQNYETALPSTLFSSGNNAFFLGSERLKAFSNCNVPNNAFFSPATDTLCLGYDSEFTNVKFAQDPTVIYHEAGHAMNKVLLNVRNRTSGITTVSTSLGYQSYDEAGGIGEGICDYFSYMMNGRSHFAEWALGRFLSLSRPMSEADPIHSAPVSTDADSRLSYPTYLNYDPNNSQFPIEDVHNAGLIASHFLMAITEDLKSYCSFEQSRAVDAVYHLIAESFAEMGDLTAYGNDHQSRYNYNLDPDNAALWVATVNPINYRRFAQTFSKFFLRTYGSNLLNLCGGTYYPQDRLEALLDSYGLLLFKTYNNNGNSETAGHTGTNISVTSTNRVKTAFTTKNQLVIDPTEGASTAYVFDKPGDIQSAIQSLQQQGRIGTLSSLIPGDFSYNNGNGQISPGEVVGITLNLYNKSNTVMAGVQLLANDWDHASNGAPCNNLGDNWPLLSEGAVDISNETGLPGECTHITKSNGGEPEETLHPVCFVEVAEASATKWVSQEVLRQKIALPKNKCLSGSASKTSDCFIRAVSGADSAHFSLINPKTTWANSVAGESGAPEFGLGNLLFFEVSPWVPPGTTFRCRIRARFSNCEDCWHDSSNGNDDYLDYEYSGGKPYKIIPFEFTVID